MVYNLSVVLRLSAGIIANSSKGILSAVCIRRGTMVGNTPSNSSLVCCIAGVKEEWLSLDFRELAWVLGTDEILRGGLLEEIGKPF